MPLASIPAARLLSRGRQLFAPCARLDLERLQSTGQCGPTCRAEVPAQRLNASSSTDHRAQSRQDVLFAYA